MNHLIQFQAEYAAEFDNIDKDTALTAAHKEAFREALSDCDDTESVMECTTRFFRANKQVGSPVVFLRNEEVFGRIYSYTALVRRVMREARLSKEDVDDLLASLKSLGKADRLLEIKHALGPLLMSPYLVWAFRNSENPADPFAGHVIVDLPCRLGLDTSSDDADQRYVAWGLLVPDDILVSTPTAFDPGLENLARWKPGGLTQPGEECAETYAAGLPEVVIQPIPFERVAGDFQEFTRI